MVARCSTSEATKRAFRLPKRRARTSHDARALDEAALRALLGAHLVYSSACSSQNTPAFGSFRWQSPSDSPGRLSQRKPSTSGSPVSVVGGRPILRPGGLHHVSSSFF